LEKRVPVNQLAVGMFVVELDRPWLDTPFLLQGFLIEDEATLGQLRDICGHVTVDPSRSILDDPGAVKGAATQAKLPHRAASSSDSRATPPPAPKRNGWSLRGFKRSVPADPPPEAKVPPQPRTPAPEVAVPPTPAFKPFAPALDPTPSVLPRKAPTSANEAIEGPSWLSSVNLFGWLRDNLGRFRGAPTKEAASAPEEAGIVEQGTAGSSRTRTRTYHDIVPIEEELGPANEGFARATQVFEGVLRDIRQGKGLEIEAVENVVEDLVESIIRNPDALQLVSRLRESDESAYTHALQVAVLLVTFGRELGFSRMELEHLGQVGMLLDIGKLRIPREILSKRGNLSPEEFEEVKRHVQYSLEMIGTSGLAHPDVTVGVAQHHERMNGTGYPGGLKDEEVGIFGRMAGIVDSFCALTSVRPYAEPLPPYDAMRLLQSWSETYFNSGLVELFIQAIGIFPIGSLVELSSGEVGVVIGQHKAQRLKPKVLVIAGPDKIPLKTPMILDLLQGVGTGGETPPYIRRGLPTESSGVDPQEYYLSRS